MLTLKKFTGINNVMPLARQGKTELASARNVEIGMSEEVRRRAGYVRLDDNCYKNLWQSPRFMLFTCGGDLTALHPDGTRALLYPALGIARVWFCDLPDGRVCFSNGLICGITDGRSCMPWGVRLPQQAGQAQAVAGGLDAGTYLYALAHVRDSDGLEGGAVLGGQVEVPQGGGILIQGLAVEPGHGTQVYLSSPNGSQLFLAGFTPGGAFSFLGTADNLTVPCRTEHLMPAMPGRLMTWWNGRVLVADGSVLRASMPFQPELFNGLGDFYQFTAPITAVQPVDDGMWVGTERELAFLAGSSFDGLAYRNVSNEGVVLGSGVSVPGDMVGLGDGGRGSGTAMLCILGGSITAGFNSGSLRRITQGRYQTAAREVAATFRLENGVPQYLAVEQ